MDMASFLETGQEYIRARMLSQYAPAASGLRDRGVITKVL